jgi:rubrerythrin
MDKMLDDFCDELEDSEKYAEMSLSCKMKGDMNGAYGFWEMAKDEYTHARFLRDRMIEEGVYHPEHNPEKEKRYHKVESMFS